MIYCPKCRTANLEGSKFCNNCGEKLGTQTSPKCPKCGTVNPAQNLSCSECGERLFSAPTSPTSGEAAPTIKGLSLPTKQAPGDDEETFDLPEPKAGQVTPSWLQELRTTLSAESGSASLEDTEELPEWLQDLRAPLSESVESSQVDMDKSKLLTGLPNVQANELEDAPFSAPESDGMEDEEIPDWLANLRAEAMSEPTEMPHEAAGPVEDEAPDWLSNLRAATFTRSAEPDLEQPGETEGEAPDWLASLRASSLTETTESNLEPLEEEGDEIPDWLASLRASSVTETTESSLEPLEEEGDEVPDWLAGLRASTLTEATESSLEPLEEEGDEVPDWLAGLRASTLTEATEPGLDPLEEEGDEAPNWLVGLRASSLSESTESSSEPLEEEEDAEPDWLASLRTPGMAEAVEMPREPKTAEEETGLPTWLADMRPDTEDAYKTTPPHDKPEETELPAWLTDRREATEDEDTVEPASPRDETEHAELPAWLTEIQPGTEYAIEPASSLDEIQEAELPAWLAGMRPGTEDAIEPKPTQPEALDDQSPDWITDLQPAAKDGAALPVGAEEVEVKPQPASQQAVVASVARTAEGEEVVKAHDMPQWLAEMVPAPDEQHAASDETVIDGTLPGWMVSTSGDLDAGESLERAEIPEWLLALKPREVQQQEGGPEDPTPTFEEPVEESGLLAGLRGTLPVEMLIAQPRAAQPRTLDKVPATDTPQARLFAQTIAMPPSMAQRLITQKQAFFVGRLPRLLIYIALIAAVAFPLILGKTFLSRRMAPTPAVADLHQTIGTLAQNAPVLVAFDYDPSMSGEMDLVAETIISHLVTQKARIVTVSLLPAGPPVAQRLLQELADADRFANLGYLPGQATAVRLMGQSLDTAIRTDFEGTPVSELAVLDNITNLGDFDLIIELAASQDTLRWWVEQAGQPYKIPLGAGVSAAVDPLARPYYETTSQQLVGVVGGVAGAASYDILRSGQDTVADTFAVRLDAQLAGHIVFVLVLLIGNGVYFVRRERGEER